jgi:hypothetical protein
MRVRIGWTCAPALVLVFALGAAQVAAEYGTPPAGPTTQLGPMKLLLKQTPHPNYGLAIPPEITGHVLLHTEGKTAGVQGVSVTDGYSVVKTDAQGAYTLTPHAMAVYVYITRPAGYNIEKQWYKPLAEQVDFALKPATQGESEYTFIHVTDTHVSTNPRSVEGLSRFVREVNALKTMPRFVVNSGDLVSLSKSLSNSPATGHAFFRNYVGIMNHLAMPYYNVAGDHTDSSYRLDEFPRGDPRCGKPLYWEYLGPNFYSFEYGKLHFVSVDSVYHLGKRQIQGREYPTNEVMPLQTAWMRQDMANRTPGSFVVTVADGDLGGHCPGFVDMAKQYDVRLQLTGNDHIVSYEDRSVPYRTAGALSGCWWNPKAAQLCPDLSPQGYLIYRVSGEQMECFYKGLGQRVAIVSHRVGAPWKGRIAVQAHIVEPMPDEVLQYTLDGKDWKAMREIGRPFYRAVYETMVDSTSLPDGLVNLRVRSSLTGEVRSREFVAINNNASATFQADASLTFTVGQVSSAPRAPAGKVDVLFNDKIVGILPADGRGAYTFRIPASSLKVANTLHFNFAETDDGMSLSSPVLTFQDKLVYDARDTTVRQVRVAHWKAEAADWGGFIAGDGALNEGPFVRRQNVFCFVLSGAEMQAP